MASSGVVVLTDGGGHATLFCDIAGLVGLTTPSLGEETRRALAALLPERCPIGNPVDFAGVAEGDPEVIPQALDICLSDPAIGAAVMVGHFGGDHRLGGPAIAPREIRAAEGMIEVYRRWGKPVHVHSVHADAGAPALAALREAGISVHRSIEMPAKALRNLARSHREAAAERPVDFRSSIARPAVASDILRKASAGSQSWLEEPEARRLLEAWGVNVPTWRAVSGAEDCAAAAAEMGGPVALKLVALGAMHKSDLGGVLLNVVPAQAAAGFNTLIERAAAASLGDARVLVTPMIRSDIELVIGAFRDDQFGPVVMVGLGGVLVELLEDVAFRLAPFSIGTASGMLGELRGRALFQGYRGKPALSTGPVLELLVRVSEMMADCPEIAEVDLNPVMLHQDRALIADARIVLRSGL